MTVYLLHFLEPIGRARHYIGCCRDDALTVRLSRHAAGTGSSLTRAAHERQIGFRLARSWPGESYEFERKLKTGTRASVLCPICSPSAGLMLSQHHEKIWLDPKFEPHAVAWDVPRRRTQDTRKGKEKRRTPK